MKSALELQIKAASTLAASKSWVRAALQIGVSLPLLWAGGFALAQSCSPPAELGQVAADGCATTVSGGSFATTGDTVPVFYALNNGSITATATTSLSLNSAGNHAPGVQTESGGNITLTGGAVTTTGAYSAYGAQAQANSAITFNGTAITTNGDSADGLQATGANAKITATSAALTVNGPSAAVAHAINSGQITLHGGAATVATPSSTATSGLYATGAGSSITADQGLQISINNGAGGFGVLADHGATVSLDTVGITSSAEVSAIGTAVIGSSVTANHVTIQTSGNGSYGVVAEDSSKDVITNSTITTSGTASFGLHATGYDPAITPEVGSEIDATNVTITTTGYAGHGAFAYNGGILNLTNVVIDTYGNYAYGLSSEGYLLSGPPEPTDEEDTNVTVHTRGDNAIGLNVVEDGTAELTGSSITTDGADAVGVLVGNSASVATLVRTPVSTVQDDAGQVVDSGTLQVTDSAWNGGRYGISSVGGASAAPNAVSFSGGSLNSIEDAFHSEATVQTISLAGATVTPANSIFANVLSDQQSNLITAAQGRIGNTLVLPTASDVELTASNVTATGNAIADAASTLDMTFTTGSHWTGASLNATNVALDATSTWTMNANSTVSQSVSNAGQIAYTAPTGDPTLLASYETLTATNYVGQSGAIALNTYLGADDSPSDRLVINSGTATGTTLLRIANTAGPGALTTGNGILVVEAIGGATTAGAFALAGGSVTKGGYQYKLYYGSVDASGPQNWYLRSTLAPASTAAPIPALDGRALALLALLLGGLAWRARRKG